MKNLRNGCEGAIDVKGEEKEVGRRVDEEAGKRGENDAACCRATVWSNMIGQASSITASHCREAMT